MFSFFHRRGEVIPEKLWALRNKLPAKLEVAFTKSHDGGYVAAVTNLPGCFTEGASFQQLYEMVNAAVYDYLDVPEQYVPFLSSYGPPPEVVAQMEAQGEKLRAGERLTFQLV